MKLNLKEVRCIWYDGYHNAFTDIIEFEGKYFCVFRHGTEHMPRGKGEVYVLCSEDLKQWQLIKKFPPLADSRDPKLFKFQNKLGVVFFAYPDLVDYRKQRDVYISYSEDGINFSEVIKLKNNNFVFWRIRPFRDKLYALGYYAPQEKENGDEWLVCLFVSEDGVNFSKVSPIVEGQFANETDLLFEKDATCFALVRREKQQTPVLAISTPPYKNWERHEMNLVLQGLHIFKFKDQIYVAGRIFSKEGTKTAILSLDLNKKHLDMEVILPSGGDTSYCGSLIKDDMLYLSYYSQHEIETRESKVEKGNTAGIYLALLEERGKNGK